MAQVLRFPQLRELEEERAERLAMRLRLTQLEAIAMHANCRDLLYPVTGRCSPITAAATLNAAGVTDVADLRPTVPTPGSGAPITGVTDVQTSAQRFPRLAQAHRSSRASIYPWLCRRRGPAGQSPTARNFIPQRQLHGVSPPGRTCGQVPRVFA